MKNLDDISIDLGKVNSLMYAAEGAMLEATEELTESNRRFCDIFYIAMDLVKQINEDFRALEGHKLVCDAVAMVNHVEELKSENAALKEYIEQLSA